MLRLGRLSFDNGEGRSQRCGFLRIKKSPEARLPGSEGMCLDLGAGHLNEGLERYALDLGISYGTAACDIAGAGACNNIGGGLIGISHIVDSCRKGGGGACNPDNRCLHSLAVIGWEGCAKGSSCFAEYAADFLI